MEMNNGKWIKVEAGVYELASNRLISVIHWKAMHPEAPTYKEDTWEMYEHEDGDNHFLDSARTASELMESIN
jgi:hypothetical protein